MTFVDPFWTTRGANPTLRGRMEQTDHRLTKLGTVVPGLPRIHDTSARRRVTRPGRARTPPRGRHHVTDTRPGTPLRGRRLVPGDNRHSQWCPRPRQSGITPRIPHDNPRLAEPTNYRRGSGLSPPGVRSGVRWPVRGVAASIVLGALADPGADRIAVADRQLLLVMRHAQLGGHAPVEQPHQIAAVRIAGNHHRSKFGAGEDTLVRGQVQP